MRTEVLVPFTFDTSAIEAKMEQVGEAEIEKKLNEVIEQGVRECIPKKYVGMYGESKPDWRQYVDSRFGEWLNEHAREIVDEAAMLLAMRGFRRKEWKAVLAEMRASDEATE